MFLFYDSEQFKKKTKYKEVQTTSRSHAKDGVGLRNDLCVRCANFFVIPA